MATYYWVGGSGTWDGSNATNWSLTSGGSPGVAVPTSADIVIFNNASGTGTCTIASGSACATATLNSSTLGVTLGANHTMSGTFTLILGALSLGSNTLSCNVFSSNNSNTRSIAFGTGNITLIGSNATIWNVNDATGFSYTGTPVVNATYSGSTGTRTFAHGGSAGGTEANTPSFYISAGSDIIALGNNQKTVDFTGFAGTLALAGRNVYGNFIISSGMTCAAGASVTTFAATSGTQQITTNGKTLDFPITFNGVGGTFQLQDNLTTGSTRTVTLTNGTLDLNSKTLSCGIFNTSNSNTRSIAFGTGKIDISGSGTTVLNAGTMTGLTCTGSRNIEFSYSGSTGTRSITPASVAGGSVESNCFNLKFLSGTDIIAFSSGRSFGNIDFDNFAGSFTTNSMTVFGNFKLSTGMSISSSTGVIGFSATSGTKTITTNGKTIDQPITFNGVGGTFEFTDALTQGSTRAFTITNGTVKLKSGVTSTVGSFLTSGTASKYLQSTLAGSRATLSQASGTVTVSYLTIKDINATGGATWNAYRNLNNIDAGNNTGWDFLSTPVTTATLSMRLGFGL